MRSYLASVVLVLGFLPARAQLGEQVRRLLNAPPDYDTNFVASYRSNLTLSLLVKYQGVDLELEPNEGTSLSFSANTAEQYGFGLSYKWLSLEATFRVPALDDVDPALGNSRSKGFGLGFTGRRLWARGFWNNTKGYYLNDPQRWTEGWKEGDLPITRPDLATDAFMVSAKYALSRKKRFSQNAALFQVERQKRSAGTFVLGFSGWRSTVSADSSILSPALVDTFQLASGFRTLDRTIAAVTIGYAATISFWRKGFIHVSLLPGFGYVHQVIHVPDDRLEGDGLGAVTEFKVGAGFNGDRWYTALSYAYYYSTTPIAEQLNLSTNYGFGRFALGIRLGAPGIKGLEKVGL
jgi:hypothetical protein